MSKKYRFAWIDDNPRRKESSDNLKASLNMAGEFIDARIDQSKMLSDLFSKPQPDVLIIDHNLENNVTGIFKKGSTLAANIRETWPDCPVICITGQDTLNVDSQKRLLYQEVISVTHISRHYNTIFSIAKSFRKLKEAKPNDVDQLLTLMKAPKEDKEKIKSIIPQELKDNFGDIGVSLIISHWLRNTFLKRPGFVYDKLWTATTLGLKETSLAKVDGIFESAKYSGIFADDSNPLWWKSKLLSILSSRVEEFGLPWEKGRFLSADFTKRDYSACHVTGDDFPETVAFVDEAKTSERAPMKISQTLPHPNYEDLLFFEEIRIMKPA